MSRKFTLQFAFLIVTITACANSGDTITVAFQYSRNLILIEGTAENQNGYFILDTGSPYFILNSKYVEKNHDTGDASLIDSYGQHFELRRVNIPNLRFANIDWGRVKGYGCDLSGLEEERGVTILGMIGLNMIKAYDLKIDCQAKTLTMFRRRADSEVTNEVDGINIPFRLMAEGICLKVTFNGKRWNFLFDTGAELSALNDELIRDERTKFNQERFSQMYSMSGKKRVVQVGTINNFSFGELYMNELRVILLRNSRVDVRTSASFGGIIGHDLLKLGIVHIDLKPKK